MRVVQGIWAHGALCLWAEDPELPPTAAVTGSAPGGVRLARPHPFASRAVELAALVAAWSVSASGLESGSASAAADMRDAARKAVHDELTLQLPTAGGGPLASPELVRATRDEPAA